MSLQRFPIVVKMALSITLVGAVALWGMLVHEQGDLLELFTSHSRMMVDEGAEDDHNHLEEQFEYLVLIASEWAQSHPLKGYASMQTPAWRGPPGEIKEYHAQPPAWLSRSSAVSPPNLPEFVLLMDDRNQLREVFSNNTDHGPLPFPALPQPTLREAQTGLLIRQGDDLYWLVTAEIMVGAEKKATLVLIEPVNETFLQDRRHSTAHMRLNAILDLHTNRILVSSHPERIPPQSLLENWSADYLISTRRTLHARSDGFQAGFVSLLTKESLEPIIHQLLSETTKNGLLYGGVFLLSATLVAYTIGSKLREITQELTSFTEISLGATDHGDQGGDELLNLRDASRNLQRKVVLDRAQQTASYEDLAMHMHISQILRTGSGHREMLEMSLDVILNLPELFPLKTGCVLYLCVEKEIIFSENNFSIMAERGDLPPSIRSLAEDPGKGKCLYHRLQYGDDLSSGSECLSLQEQEEGESGKLTWIIPLRHAKQLFGALIVLSKTGVNFSLDRFRALRLVGETIAAHLHADSLTNSLRERHQALAQTLEEIQFATHSLRLSENRLSGILSMLPALFIEVNRSGVVSQWNQMASTLTGIPPEQARGRHVHALEIQWDLEQIQAEVTKALASGSSRFLQRFHFRVPGRRDGVLDLTITPILLEDHGGYFLMGMDITERTRMEIRLAQAQKMEAIGTLAAGIAHEINTPTQFIGDNTHFLKDAFTDLDRILEGWRALAVNLPEESALAKGEMEALEYDCDLPYLQKEIPAAISQILQGVERISSIVRAMKDFSYPDQGVLSKVDINKAIMDTVTIARNEYKYVADLDTDLDPDLPLTPGYRNELNQAFLNILVNAAQSIAEKKEKTGSERGRITISSRTEGDEVVLKFTDTGMGIPERLRQRIFEPFFTTKPVGKGTGQGLAIVHSVVVGKHRGSIHVESEPGEGTLFVLQLPLDENRLNAGRNQDDEKETPTVDQRS